ncbi:hypothetical protein GCK72_000681 [Caenorhabditis remanei]|uniref:F-box domain-containing protein n=1 Tax=Caenorhabditis remanei TaxID=31234 RepID=A0A6A5HLT8_CAERE|nr:hypothetical protein GCK72_000681 [Caenorhabditis remanei]KAF1768868.1 hypothetical protein GCK72_000681 [Caenorhabditis remanei]
MIFITYSSTSPDEARISSSYNYKEFINLVSRKEAKDQSIVRMNLFGVDVDCCMATRNHPFFILCNQQNGEQMLQTIHNYFRGFFGLSIEYHLRCGCLNYVPRLENINISRLAFLNRTTGAQLLEQYLTVSPSQEYLQLLSVNGFEYERHLKLMQTEIFDTVIPDSKAAEILNYFKGRHLFIRYAIITDEEVIQFLNSWKSSQTHQNLEYLSIRLGGEIDLNPENIMRNLDIKQFDPRQKMPIYRYDRRYPFHQCGWTTAELRSPNFIVRDTDQHVASLEITNRTIKFAAWKMTEEEVKRVKIHKPFQKNRRGDPIVNFIKISKMPWLVQKEILSSMELVDLLMMASCSQKFYQNMKSLIRNKRFTISYKATDILSVDISSSSSGDRPFMNISWSRWFEVRSYMTIDFCGMELKVSMPTENGPLMVQCNPSQEETILPSIHNYFLDLFGSSIKYQLNVRTLTSKLSKMRSITNTDLSHSGEIGTTEFQDFLTVSPNQDFIRLMSFENPSLGENSQFKRTKILDIGYTYCSADDILSNFEGRQLFIEKGIISDIAVIQFLKKWKSNEGYQNLEYLSISLRTHRCQINSNIIMNSILINRLDQSDKLPVYTFDKRGTYFGHTWRINQFSSPNYIVRDSDQHVASIMVTENNFTFAAWNMTEKAFLEKHSFKRFY